MIGASGVNLIFDRFGSFKESISMGGGTISSSWTSGMQKLSINSELDSIIFEVLISFILTTVESGIENECLALSIISPIVGGVAFKGEYVSFRDLSLNRSVTCLSGPATLITWGSVSENIGLSKLSVLSAGVAD